MIFYLNTVKLPPYYPDLNSIEFIWTTVKSNVAQRNTTFKLGDAEKISRITETEWRKRQMKIKMTCTPMAKITQNLRTNNIKWTGSQHAPEVM